MTARRAKNDFARKDYYVGAPPLRLCTDNAVMVAWAGIERLRAGLADPLDHEPRARWPLSETSAFTACSAASRQWSWRCR